MELKTILQRAGISLLLATATRAAPQGRQTTRTNLATYDSCDAKMVSKFESYLPDQDLLASDAFSALKFLEQNVHEKDLSKTIDLVEGEVDLSTLRNLVVRFFGKDAIPALSVETEADSNAQSTEQDDQARLENLRSIRDVFARVHKVLANKPIIVCRDDHVCKEDHHRAAFVSADCEFDLPGVKTCPYPSGVPYINVCPANIHLAKAHLLKPFSSVYSSGSGHNIADATNAFWGKIEASTILIHEFTHTQIFASRNKTFIADQQPLIDGKDFCSPYGLGATQLMADADSYLAMRNADNYAQFSSMLAVSAGHPIPTKESFIMNYRSRKPHSFGACTPINLPASELRTDIFTRLRSLEPESSNKTYGEVYPELSKLFQDFPSKLKRPIYMRLSSVSAGLLNQTYGEIWPMIEWIFQDIQ